MREAQAFSEMNLNALLLGFIFMSASCVSSVSLDLSGVSLKPRVSNIRPNSFFLGIEHISYCVLTCWILTYRIWANCIRSSNPPQSTHQSPFVEMRTRRVLAVWRNFSDISNKRRPPVCVCVFARPIVAVREYFWKLIFLAKVKDRKPLLASVSSKPEELLHLMSANKKNHVTSKLSYPFFKSRT